MAKKNVLVSRSNKGLVLGTILKILLPGTGIGSMVTAYGWANAFAHLYLEPEAYSESIETFIATDPKSYYYAVKKKSEKMLTEENNKEGGGGESQ